MGPYHLQDTDEFIRVLHLNVLGTMLCVKHSVPYMVKAGGGSFVEVQGTAEGATFARGELDSMLGLAEKGIGEIVELQRSVLADPPAPR